MQHNKIVEETTPPILYDADSGGYIDIVDIQLNRALLNEVIGYFHEGYPFIKPVTYYGYHANYPKTLYINDLKTELHNANYPISGSSTSLFNKDSQTQSEPDLLIGGTIKKLNFDSYSYVTGRNSEAKVMVKWEVYDSKVNKVIFEKMAFGSATGPMSITETEPVTMVGAVQSSFKKILSDAEFANAVKHSLKNNR
jgi:hypothetical protein